MSRRQPFAFLDLQADSQLCRRSSAGLPQHVDQTKLSVNNVNLIKREVGKIGG